VGSAWRILKAATMNWMSHGSPRMGAALAYYSVFSMGPLLVLVTAVAGLFFGQEAVQGELTGQFRALLGPTGAQALEAMLAGAASEQSGQAAAIIGVVLLIIAAVGVVAQMKDAMNTIWEVDQSAEGGLWYYIRTYTVSLAGILALGLLLIISLVASAALSALSQWLGGGSDSGLWRTIEFLASLAILAALFAMLFKWFPDADIAWRDVWPGAVVTALLFNFGKVVIGWYVGTRGLDSTYGAAASIVVLLIWVYYSSQIVLFGAELTQAYASQKGSRQGRPHAASPALAGD